MKLISRYILSKFFSNTLLLLLVFILVFSIFNIIGELSNLGKGAYNTTTMLTYIASLLPSVTYLLIPLAVLIGIMISMFSLVNYSEYAIIRTAGVSITQITTLSIVFSFLFTIITFILGEFVVPYTNNYAKLYKISHTHEVVSAQLKSGIWTRDGINDFVNIKQILPDETIIYIRIFHYDNNFQLHTYSLAKEAIFDKKNHYWLLKDVFIKDYKTQNINIIHKDLAIWHTSINPSYFDILIISPEDMSLVKLNDFMQHLKRNKQSIRRYQISFWAKLLYPLSCVAMSLIGIAFTPNNRRNINLASKLFLSVLIGLTYFFASKLFAYMALIFAFNPIVATITPSVVLFISSIYAILKKK